MQRRGVWAGFLAIYVIWGSTYLAIAHTVTAIPPIFMVAVRGALAGGVLYLWSRVRGGEPMQLAEMVKVVPTAALLFGGGYVLVAWAEQWVSSGPAALLNATTPAWVVLIEWGSGKRGRPGLRTIAALVAGVVGVGVLVGGGAGDGARLPVLPAIALVLASAAWGAGTVRARAEAHGNATRSAAVQLITGSLLLLPVSALKGEGSMIIAGATGRSLLALTYLIVFGSLIGYSAYVWLLHHVPASKVASHSYVNPLIAVMLGALLAGESVGVHTITAAFLIVVSVVLIITERPAAVVRRARIDDVTSEVASQRAAA